ncbi:MAG TPA: dipeptide/oligopeptide/nickel ABC transporter ATP-binding protein, partial [Amaricoccus sp.]|nr:dipeptide/oligopeptide/nickel ABC transporter ATP-binding protein [Amaricoccus sp.]
MTALLEVRNLSVRYPIRGGGLRRRTTGWVSAVDEVSLSVAHGETMGLVGESGSGKTSFGLAVLRGVEPSSGTITLGIGGGIDVTALDKPALRRARRHMQMIFQDPYASLNPRMTVRDILSEPLVAGAARGLYPDRKSVDAKVIEIAGACGLSREQLGRLPHAFSGGQRQRIAIARALVLNPELVVCDEPISSLDVSIQAQILNLLAELQERLGLTYLFIAHDLAAVAYVCD